MAGIALYGGAFDPPHSAHLFAITWLLGLPEVDEVWLLPTADHVFGKQMAPFEDRIGMLQAAIAPFDAQRVRVSRFEAERVGPSRTFDTLTALSAQHPEHTFQWVLGADNLAERHRWHRFDDLVARWSIIAFGRPGFEGALAAVAAAPWCRPGPTLPDVSSTAVRAALGGQGTSAALDWVPEAVRQRAGELYAHPSSASAALRVGVLGQGGAGAALAAALRAGGCAVQTWNRAPGRDADAHGPGWPDWLAACDVWLLAVSDPALAPLAAALASEPAAAGRTVLHVAGRFGAEVLAPLAAVGARTGSLHPLQALRGAESAGRLRGAWCACEGEAADTAEALVRAFGGLPIRVPAGEKATWHCAAVLAANFITTLGAGAQQLLAALGISADDARALLAPLQRGTVELAARQPLADALTGPLARRDLGAVSAHIGALIRHAPAFLPAYRALAEATAVSLGWPAPAREALAQALAAAHG